MAVSDTTNITSAVGSGVVGQIIPFTFPITATSDLLVYDKVTATGVETLLTETTNYTVTISGDAGGSVTTVTAVAATSEIYIIRATPKTQTIDLEAGGNFGAEQVEDCFDKLTKISIDNSSGITRCIHAPLTDDDALTLELPVAASRASKYLSFDASGNVTATSTLTTGAATFGAFGTTMAATATAGAAQTALGLSPFVITLIDDTTATAFLATLGLTVSAFGKTIIDDAAATNVLTTLGVSTFIKTLIDDTTAALARATLGALAASDIVCYEDTVVCYENEVVTY